MPAAPAEPGASSVPEAGALTPEQMALVLKHLSVDVSLMDEDHVLVYWRGPTFEDCDDEYVGRHVDDCHNAKSRVSIAKMIETFAAGTRDEEVFWHVEDGHQKVDPLHRRARRRRRLPRHDGGHHRSDCARRLQREGKHAGGMNTRPSSGVRALPPAIPGATVAGPSIGEVVRVKAAREPAPRGSGRRRGKAPRGAETLRQTECDQTDP